MNGCYRKVPVIILLVMAIPVSTASGEEPSETGGKFDGGVAVDLYSRYLWRGIPLSNGGVLQPSGWLNGGPLTFSLWANFVLDEAASRRQFSEIDYVLSFEKSTDNVDLTLSLFYFQYPGAAPPPATGEAVLDLSRSVGDYYLTLTSAVDYLEYSSAYYGSLAASRAIPIYGFQTTHALLTGWASAKFCEANVGIDRFSPFQIEYSAGLQYDRGGYNFEPRLTIAYQLDSRIRENFSEPLLIAAGLSVSREF